MSEVTLTADSAAQDTEVPSRGKRILKMVGWAALALFLLVFFTIAKLPEDRIRNLANGYLSSFLAEKGMTFTAAKSGLNVGFGISYAMKDVTLNPPPPDSPIKIDEIVISPSLTSLLLGRQAGKAWIKNAGGSIAASFSLSGGNTVNVSFDAEDFDFGKAGLVALGTRFAMSSPLAASGILNGKGTIEGNFNIPSTLVGDIDIELKKVVIDQQNLFGFAIPKLNISEGKIALTMDKGKATVKSLQLGKPGNTADDIHLTGTGDVLLGKQMESSTLNLKLNFSYSQSLSKALILLDTFLIPGKRPDGTYAYVLNGPMTSPNFAPAGGQ